MLEEPVGVSVILFLIIKELLTFIKERKDKWNGSERRLASIDDIDNSIKLYIIPIMNQQVLILSELKELAMQGHDAHIRLQGDVDTLKFNDERIRTNLHNISDKLHGKSLN